MKAIFGSKSSRVLYWPVESEKDMASHRKHFYSPEEYLALERKAAYKSEYYAGEIFAMSGASREHNLIVVNVATLLNMQLEDRKSIQAICGFGHRTRLFTRTRM
jgi:Uma2 family endonuclease